MIIIVIMWKCRIFAHKTKKKEKNAVTTPKMMLVFFFIWSLKAFFLISLRFRLFPNIVDKLEIFFSLILLLSSFILHSDKHGENISFNFFVLPIRNGELMWYFYVELLDISPSHSFFYFFIWIRFNEII